MDAIKNRISYYWSLKFIRDIFILQAGAITSTGMNFLASIIYARLLGAKTYGDYALIFAFASLIGVFMDWGTQYASLTLLSEAYVRRDRQEIKNILTYYFKLGLIVAAVVGLTAIIFSPRLAGFFYHRPEIGNLARFILLAVIIRIFFSCLVNVLQVLRKIKYLAIFESLDNLASRIVPIVFVFLGLGLWGIVSGYLVAGLATAFFSFWAYSALARRNELVPGIREIISNLNKIKIYNYFKFGFSVAVDKNISSVFNILPIFILGSFSSAHPENVANLKIALSYIALPNILISPISRLLQVQLPKAMVAGVRDLKVNFYKSSIYSGIIYIFLTLGLIAFAPFFVGFFYGPEFKLSTGLIYPLGLGMLFTGFTIGLGSLYRTINKNIVAIFINIGGLATGFILFFILLKYTSPLKSVVILLVYWSIYSVIAHLTYVYRFLKKMESKQAIL